MRQRVVRRVMPERLAIEVRAGLAIGAHQEILIERRRHAGRVVVRRVKDRRVLHQIDADQQTAAVQRLPRLPQERRSLGAREIADGRAGEEAGTGAGTGRQRPKGDGAGEIAGHRPHAQPAILVFQDGRDIHQIVARDVDRQIGACVAQDVQQDAHLAQRAGAELDQLHVGTDQRGDLVRVGGQDAELGACRVIFRQHGDLLEQFRSRCIIEEFRADPLGRAEEAVQQRLGEVVFGLARAERDHGGAHTSPASRMPLNCQRADGGKKLR